MADLTITAANVGFSTSQTGLRTDIVMVGTVAVTPGDTVYQAAGGAYELAFADSAQSATIAAGSGIVMTPGGVGDYVVICRAGVIEIGATTVAGQTYVVSPTAAGGVAPESDLGTGDFYRRVGYAQDTTGTIVLDFSGTVWALP